MNEENYKREIKWCLDWMKKLSIDDSILVTFEQETGNKTWLKNDKSNTFL